MATEQEIRKLIKKLRSDSGFQFNRGAAVQLKEIGFDVISTEDKIRCLVFLEKTKKIVKMGDKAIPELIKLLNVRIAVVRITAAKTLKKIGLDKISIAEKIRCLLILEKTNEIRKPGEDELKGLINALNDIDHKVVDRAAQILGANGSDIAIQGLLSALECGDCLTWSSAAKALGETRTVEAVEPMIKALEGRWEARETAAKVLLKIGSNETAINHPKFDWSRIVAGLISNLHYERYEVRVVTALTLGKLGVVASKTASTQAKFDWVSVVKGLVKGLKGRRAHDATENMWVKRSVAEALLDIQRSIKKVFSGKEKFDWLVVIKELVIALGDEDFMVKRDVGKVVMCIAEEVGMKPIEKVMGDYVVKESRKKEAKEKMVSCMMTLINAKRSEKQIIEKGKLSDGKPKPPSNSKKLFRTTRVNRSLHR